MVKKILDLFKKFLLALLCVVLVLVIALESKSFLAMRRIPDTAACATAVEDLQISPQSHVVALGEATHGNREFQSLKLEILKKLVQNNDCRALAMELDFGDALAVDDYIQGGEGEPRALAASLGYPIYHTQQITELIDWMRDYNCTAPEGERLHFYGFDMQNTIPGARYLLDFCRQNNLPGLTEALREIERLAGTSAALDAESAAVLEEQLRIVAKALRLQNADGTETALQASETQMQAMGSYAVNGEEYADYRNACMADNVAWIAQQQGGRTVMIAAHNAHIARSWPDGSRPMGQLLAERLGQGYYAIGTDFFTAEVNIKTSAMVSDTYDRSNHSFCSADPLAYQARWQPDGRYFLDFGPITPDSVLYKTLHTTQPMGNIGEGYLPLWYFFPESSYRTQAVPAALYDGMIYLYHANPTDVWDRTA